MFLPRNQSPSQKPEKCELAELLLSVLHCNPYLKESVGPAYQLAIVQCHQQGGTVSLPKNYPASGVSFFHPEIPEALKKIRPIMSENKKFQIAGRALKEADEKNMSFIRMLLVNE